MKSLSSKVSKTDDILWLQASHYVNPLFFFYLVLDLRNLSHPDVTFDDVIILLQKLNFWKQISSNMSKLGINWLLLREVEFWECNKATLIPSCILIGTNINCPLLSSYPKENVRTQNSLPTTLWEVRINPNQRSFQPISNRWFRKIPQRLCPTHKYYSRISLRQKLFLHFQKKEKHKGF